MRQWKGYEKPKRKGRDRTLSTCYSEFHITCVVTFFTHSSRTWPWAERPTTVHIAPYYFLFAPLYNLDMNFNPSTHLILVAINFQSLIFPVKATTIKQPSSKLAKMAANLALVLGLWSMIMHVNLQHSHANIVHDMDGSPVMARTLEPDGDDDDDDDDGGYDYAPAA